MLPLFLLMIDKLMEQGGVNLFLLRANVLNKHSYDSARHLLFSPILGMVTVREENRENKNMLDKEETGILHYVTAD